MVTGSSGFVGRHLVKKIADASHKVISVYRHKLPEPLAQVFPVCCDLDNVDNLKNNAAQANTIVHLAWDRSFFGPDFKLSLNSIQEKTLPTPNLRAMQNLIQLAEAQKTRRFVFASVLGAERYREDSPFLLEKYLAEVLLLNSKIPEKVIIKSGLVCGSVTQQDNFMKSVIGLMKFPVIYPVPKRQEPLAPIYVDDFAECVKKIALKPNSPSLSLYEIAGPEALKVEDVFKLISDRVVGGGRLQLKGYLGQSLLPFFEGQSKTRQTLPSVSQFLAIQTSLPGAVNPSNTQQITQDLGLNLKSFRDVLSSTN
jgi:nucleoside-diphosphate-sugar epimerase